MWWHVYIYGHLWSSIQMRQFYYVAILALPACYTYLYQIDNLRIHQWIHIFRHHQDSHGNTIPCLGYGTWVTFDEDIHVLNAIRTGYRHIDTATVYKSEAAVGRALKQCGISRDQFFLTTKTPKTDLNAIDARKCLEQSLRYLQTNYVDLLLIHWPRNNKICDWKNEINETWA